MKTVSKSATSTTLPGGTFKLADNLILTRIGYGAMQLAGPHVFGPPADHAGVMIEPAPDLSYRAVGGVQCPMLGGIMA
jgi:hypothetical protein